MTIDEAVTYIEDIKNGLHETGKDFPYRDEVIPVAKEALDIAIKALEQEPCGDAISRTKAIKTIQRYGVGALDFEDYTPEQAERFVINQLNELPSVLPQQKVGKWIMKHRTYNKVKHYTGQDEMGEIHTISVLERYEVDEPYCSECGKLAGDTSQDFCCACGAKMVEPQESEV